MAITLQDEPLEAKIHQLGRQRGLDPVTVIAQAVDVFAKTPISQAGSHANAGGPAPEEIARRKAIMQEFLAEMAAKTTDEDRRIAREIEADMYDENGLPK